MQEIYPIKTDYEDLDKIIGGFYPGELTIIGSRPATGKSSFLITLIKRITLISCIPGLFFSIEMPAIRIYSRLVALISGISYFIVRGYIDSDFSLKRDNDKPDIFVNLLKQVQDFPFIINDKAHININEICAEARKVCKKKRVQIIYIDYFGLITTDNKKDPFTAQASCIIKKLKNLALELNIPIVITCMLSRCAEPSQPQLKDFECSAIENISDNIILMYEEHSYDTDFNPIKLIVAKNKHGEIGNIDLMFVKNTLMFMSKDFIGQL